jgi:rhamnose transport system permease protein
MKWRLLAPAILILLTFVTMTRLSPYFADPRYLLNSSTLYMEIGLIALGMTFVIVSGNIDLSVGSNVVLTACLTAKLFSIGWSMPTCVVAACVIGMTLGVFNGVLVAKLKLPSFLVTLGTMATYRGAAQAMMGPSSIKLPRTFVGIDMAAVGGIPWPLIIFLVAAVLMGLLLHQTVFGRWVFALGTNESASNYAGVPVDRVKILSFALLGLMCGISALLVDSRLGIARYDLATGIELDAITVVVVGGTPIAGGAGMMLGTVLALALIDLLKTGMGVENVKAEYQLTGIGLLLILTVLTVNVTNSLSGRMKRLRLSQD